MVAEDKLSVFDQKVTPDIAEFWEPGLSVKPIKEFVRNMASSNSMKEGNDSKNTVHINERLK